MRRGPVISFSHIQAWEIDSAYARNTASGIHCPASGCAKVVVHEQDSNTRRVSSRYFGNIEWQDKGDQIGL